MIVYKKQRFEKKATKDRHFIGNADLIPLLQEYKQTRVMTNEFASALMLVAKKLASSNNFRNYDYAEDFIQDALLCCVKYIHNFDLEKSQNPFGYITEIMKISFLSRINNESKWTKLKEKARMYDADGVLILDEEFVNRLLPTTNSDKFNYEG